MESTDELDMDPDGKTLFDEGQRNVPMKQDSASVIAVNPFEKAVDV